MRSKIAGLVLMLAAGMSAMAQAGTDATSGIAWALISMDGNVVGGQAKERPPRLTAQCSKDAKGKMRFELLADAGDVPEVRFVAPFDKATDPRPNPPILAKIVVTM